MDGVFIDYPSIIEDKINYSFPKVPYNKCINSFSMEL